MGYSYDTEAAMQKLPPAIEAVETFTQSRCTQVKDSIMEIAKQVNADKLTKICEQACAAVDAAQKMYQEVVGQDGDEMHDGTLHGALKGTKKLNDALNGG